MATISTSIGRVELTVSELRELIGAAEVRQNAAAEVVPNYASEDVLAKFEGEPTKRAAKVADDGLYHYPNCGHTVARKQGAGRYPKCKECNSSNSAAEVEHTEAPKMPDWQRSARIIELLAERGAQTEAPKAEKKPKSSGYRKSTKTREFDMEKFLASDAAKEEMSLPMRQFILRLLGELKAYQPTARKVSKARKNSILKALDSFNKGQASLVINELLALPLA